MADWAGFAFDECPDGGLFPQIGAEASQLTIHQIAGGGIVVQAPANADPAIGQSLTLRIQGDQNAIDNLRGAVYSEGTLNYSGGTIGGMLLQKIADVQLIAGQDTLKASATWLKVE